MIYEHAIGLDGIKSHAHNLPVLEKESSVTNGTGRRLARRGLIAV